MNKAQLQRLFDEGRAPTLDQLLGPEQSPCEWEVTMETGPIPNVPTWRKRLWPTSPPLRVLGENVIGPFHWGRFFTYCGDAGGSLVLDYMVADNGRVTRRVHDLVRTTPDPNVLLGKFFFLWRDRLCGGWFFTLTRMEGKR